MPAERGPSGTGHDTAASERVLNRVLLCPHRKDCLDNGCTGCCEQDPPLCRDGSNVTHRAPDLPPVAVPGPASPARVPCPNCGATDATRGSGLDAPCEVCAPGPASVSPADTITIRARLNVACRKSTGPFAGEWEIVPDEESLTALDALLAVGERDKAEIEALRGCPAGNGCAINAGAIHCYHCRRNYPPDDTWEQAFLDRPDLRQGEIRTLHSILDEKLSAGERDRRQIAQLTERLTDAQQLLSRFEFLRHGSGARRPMDGESLEHFACPVCGWPQGGHGGPGRYKGNAENTHEEGCSLYAALHGEPAPRLRNRPDRPADDVLAGEEDAANG